MIEPETIVRIRQLYFAGEHWKIGTIAAQLDLHHDTVRAMRSIPASSTPRPCQEQRRAANRPDLWSSSDKP